MPIEPLRSNTPDTRWSNDGTGQANRQRELSANDSEHLFGGELPSSGHLPAPGQFGETDAVSAALGLDQYAADSYAYEKLLIQYLADQEEELKNRKVVASLTEQKVTEAGVVEAAEAIKETKAGAIVKAATGMVGDAIGIAMTGKSASLNQKGSTKGIEGADNLDTTAKKNKNFTEEDKLLESDAHKLGTPGAQGDDITDEDYDAGMQAIDGDRKFLKETHEQSQLDSRAAYDKLSTESKKYFGEAGDWTALSRGTDSFVKNTGVSAAAFNEEEAARKNLEKEAMQAIAKGMAATGASAQSAEQAVSTVKGAILSNILQINESNASSVKNIIGHI